MNDKINFDIAVIGGGPAGYTAAIYAGRAGYTCAVFEKMSPGGQMGITSSIENYPGFSSVDGFELASKMMEQASGFGAKMKYEEVTAVELEGKIKTVKCGAKEYTCRAVVLALGAKPRLIGVPGEAKYTGRGVSYCATCDGMFFRGKTVIVNGGGDTAFEDAMYLSNVCEKVYLVHRRDAFRAAASMVRKAEAKENIEFVKNAVITEIEGDGAVVTGAKIKNTLTGEESFLEAEGIFAAIGRVPDTALVKGMIDLDDYGYIIADESTKTSMDGVYAAGDVRTKSLRQIVTACADGANAIHHAEEWLSEE